MESSPFLYYNPSHQSRQHGQFVSHPPVDSNNILINNNIIIHNNNKSMPFPSIAAMVYSSSQRPSSINTPSPMLALTAEALQKSSGLLTPSSPNLMGLDGPNGGDIYFFPPTPTLESSDSSSAMSSHLSTPTSQPWGLDESCSGTLTPAELELPSTPQFWKERSPISPGMN